LYNNKFIFPGKFIFEYNLKNDDIIKINRFNQSVIQLTVKYGRNKKITFPIYPTDKINILLEAIPSIDKDYMLIYGSKHYYVSTVFTFEEIGIIKDVNINIVNPVKSM